MGVYKFSAPGTLKTGRTLFTSMLAGNPVFVAGAYESIATTTVGAGGVSSITFSSIPSTYQHLQLRTFVQQASTGGYVEILMTGSTFVRRHYIVGDGASATAGSDITNAPGVFSSAFSITNLGFAGSILDIFDYNSLKNKTTRSLGGVDNNGSGAMYFMSGLYTSTSAITSITLNAISQNFTQYSHFALYGIKGVA